MLPKKKDLIRRCKRKIEKLKLRRSININKSKKRKRLFFLFITFKNIFQDK